MVSQDYLFMVLLVISVLYLIHWGWRSLLETLKCMEGNALPNRECCDEVGWEAPMTIRVAIVRSNRRSRILLGLAVNWFALAGAAARAQTKDNTRSEIERLTYSLKGRDLFRAHCAACHVSDGKGDGPVAPAQKAKVPDLTLLAKNNAGQFPSARVRKWIAGDEVLLSHGSREMPIWGPIFHQIESDQDFGNVRLQNLTKYLESIQQK